MDSNRDFVSFYKDEKYIEPYVDFLIKNIEDVDKPVKNGEFYNVPCVVEIINNEKFITPIINLPHSDVENGQDYHHYHADTRFIYLDKTKVIKSPIHFSISLQRKIYYCSSIRIRTHKDIVIERFILMVRNEVEDDFTLSIYISNSKLKHKCIHKGRCPHRGMDLSQVPIDERGIIRCPLHGLEFDTISKKILIP